MFISTAYAQTAGGEGFQSTFLSLLPLLLMFLVLYLIMIRPQMKKQKEHRNMVASLAKGDEVSTAGGLVGRVVRVQDTQIDLEIASGVVVQVQRHAVAQLLPKGSVKQGTSD